MDRKTLDRLLAAGGVAIAAVLLVAGGLLTWAHSYVHDEVHSQLAAEKIYFPTKDNASLIALPAADRAAMDKYAGQQLLTGAQAKTWADHFIAVHLREMGGGKTYAQLSSEALAQPTNTKLAGLVQTVFRGETLRGLLLNAYAFDTMGNIALIGAIVAYIGAAVMAVLAALGFVHANRVHRRTAPAFPAQETING
jgi:hypothetical protein